MLVLILLWPTVQPISLIFLCVPLDNPVTGITTPVAEFADPNNQANLPMDVPQMTSKHVWQLSLSANLEKNPKLIPTPVVHLAREPRASAPLQL